MLIGLLEVRLAMGEERMLRSRTVYNERYTSLVTLPSDTQGYQASEKNEYRAVTHGRGARAVDDNVAPVCLRLWSAWITLSIVSLHSEWAS